MSDGMGQLEEKMVRFLDPELVYYQGDLKVEPRIVSIRYDSLYNLGIKMEIKVSE